MQLGQIEIHSVSGGRFQMDGGTMFGVVPQVLWSRKLPPDARNRIPQQTNCLLVKSESYTALIDTGYGSKLPDKQQKVLESEPGAPLLDHLAEHGVQPDDVDLVILSHLHFDHAGGATSRAADGALHPTFPQARYVVQQREWALATADHPELRGAYPQENLLPLQESGQLQLIAGETEIAPRIRALPTPGHTLGHQSLLVEGDQQSAIYLGDLCPTAHHLPMAWCLAFDTHLWKTRRTKARVLKQAVDNEWLCVFDHDPQTVAAEIEADPRHDFCVRRAWSDLSQPAK